MLILAFADLWGGVGCFFNYWMDGLGMSLESLAWLLVASALTAVEFIHSRRYIRMIWIPRT